MVPGVRHCEPREGRGSPGTMEALPATPKCLCEAPRAVATPKGSSLRRLGELEDNRFNLCIGSSYKMGKGGISSHSKTSLHTPIGVWQPFQQRRLFCLLFVWLTKSRSPKAKTVIIGICFFDQLLRLVTVNLINL